MEAHTFRYQYRKEGEEFPFFFASDLHQDEIGFNEQQFATDFDRAKRDKARIFLNGDIFGAILPQDIKRYSRGNDPNDTDGIINVIVEQAENRLAPYVDNIDMIGIGNHETAVLKYHATDITRMLIAFLNRRRNPKLPPIRHGGYTGFIRMVFDRTGGANAHALVIFYNHGQGSSAEVTDGIIDAKRRLYTRSDIIWLGHKHRRWVHEIEPEIGINNFGKIYVKKRYAVMTGSYLQSSAETDATKNGYRQNFAEERMRTPQGTGGIRWTAIVGREFLYPEFVI